jgi:hypothetical protein
MPSMKAFTLTPMKDCYNDIKMTVMTIDILIMIMTVKIIPAPPGGPKKIINNV